MNGKNGEQRLDRNLKNIPSFKNKNKPSFQKKKIENHLYQSNQSINQSQACKLSLFQTKVSEVKTHAKLNDETGTTKPSSQLQCLTNSLRFK